MVRIPAWREVGAMSRLALPIVTAQLGLMAMGVVDTLMVGRVSAEALAAVALGNIYFLVFVFPASGTLMVLDPVVAQAVGAKDEQAVASGIQRGFVLAVLLTLVVSVALLPVRSVLELLHQPPVLVPIASSYVLISILGILPFLGFVVVRQSLQAFAATRPVVLVIVAANAMNAFLNWVFVYGHLGVVPMGAVGSAWATFASRWAMLVFALAFGWKHLHHTLLPWRAESFRWSSLRSMLTLGLPIGLHQGLELGAFAAIGVLMGVLGTTEMAAHQIAINLASLTFMVPLGVGAAAAVRVGHAAGAGASSAAKESARAALACGAGFMGVAGVVLLAIPGAIAAVYTTDVRVLSLATALIPIAGVFQVFDGIQAVCAGVLRGLGDTRAAFVINLGGFWLVGFPVSIYLGFHTSLRALGLWWGLVFGLGVVASLLLWRVRHQLKGEIVRTVA